MKKNLLLSLLILTLFSYPVSAQTAPCSGTLSLVSDYDAAIGYHDGANTAGNNYGTAPQNAAFAIPSVAGPGLNVNRALIHFNLSSLPANAIITNAELDLFAYGPVGAWPGHGGTANNAYIERVTAPWSENTVTWNNQPPSTTTNQLFVAGTTNATLDYLNLNVTQIINDIVLSGNNYGMKLRLIAENPSNLLFFCSEDHPNPAKWPVLRVYYTLNTPTVTISGPSSVCFGQSANLTASGAATFTWSNGSTNQNVLVMPIAGVSTYSVLGGIGTCTGSAVISITAGECTGVNEIANTGTEFLLYPNPATEAILVNYNITQFSEGKISIEDVRGRIVRTVTLENSVGTVTLSLNELDAGVYICKLRVNAENALSKKLIIVK